MTVGGLFLTSTASAQTVGKGKTPKPTKVVKEVVRGSFGEILTNKMGHTLYIQPGGTCTGGCLTIWPPLLMPKGKTVPGGVASGLGTVSTGSGLQVTYNGMPLYTFYTDTKTSTSGENVGGFVVAQVSGSTS
jgi:predicted lipoprotein with Yx(FWY)xxD motif